MRYSIAILICLTAGCLSHRPGSYSVDPECDQAHTEVIREVARAYCHETGLCMGLRPFPRSELVINCTTESFGSADGRAGYDFDYSIEGDYIIELRIEESIAWQELDVFWRVVAHEMAHTFGVIKHSSGIMGETVSRGPAALDYSVLCPLIGEECQVDEPTTTTVSETAP